MATVKNTIVLQDKMSTSLKSINKELKNTQKTMKDVNDITDGGFSTSTKKVRNMEKEVDKLNRNLRNTSNESRNVKNNFEKMGTAFDVFKGTVLGGIAYKVGSDIVNGIKNTVTSAINYASDLQEVQNVVDTTFGKSSKVINSWSKNALKAFGLNEVSAKNYASTYGAMMKASGVVSSDMLKMSIGLTQLTGDVASFRNIRPEEAFYKLKSVITGETETMKELGVVMTEVNLKNFAATQGIKKSYKEMSQAERIALRYNFTMKALADAQGDFSKTSTSYANQTKLLSENWSKFTGTIANYVVPILALLLRGLNAIISFLGDHIDSVIIALSTLAIILGLVAAKALMVGTASLIAGVQAAIAWLGALWPIILIIGAIGILLILLNEFGVSVSQVISFVVGLLTGFGSTVYNIFVLLWNIVAAFVNFLANVFVHPIQSIKMLFYDMAISVIGFIQDIARSIEDLLNAIPMVEVDITSGINSVYNNLTKNRDKLKEKSDIKKVMGELQFTNSSDIASKVYKGTNKGLSNIGNMLSGLNDFGSSMPNVSDLYGNTSIPGLGNGMGSLGKKNNIDKVGKVGKIEDDVSITDEDIELLKDVAKVDYVNQFTTMNPSVTVTFGDVHETADVNEITQVISEMVKESIATSLV